MADIIINPQHLSAGTPLLPVHMGLYGDYRVPLDNDFVQVSLFNESANVIDNEDGLYDSPDYLELVFAGGRVVLIFRLQEDGSWKLTNKRSQNAYCMYFKPECDEDGKPVKADEETTALISGAIRETERLRKRMLAKMRQDSTEARTQYEKNLAQIERLQAENVKLRKLF